MDEITINKMKRPELLALIKQTLTDVNTIRTALKEATEEKGKIVDTAYEILKTTEETGEEGHLEKILSATKETETKLQEIRDAYAQICEDGDDEGEESIRTELETLTEKFAEEQIKVESFKKDLWGHDVVDQEGKRTHVKGLMDNINDFHKAQKEKYDELYSKIEQELLSGATAVNLALVFESKVSEYKNRGNWWAGSFIFLILAMAVYYGAITFSTEAAKSYEEVWLHILFRAPFLLFVIWLAKFIGNRRAENKKLEESYKHKAVMARAYTGYKEAIKDLDNEDNELLRTHMTNLLNTMNIDSSDFLETEGEKHPFYEVLSQFVSKEK